MVSDADQLLVRRNLRLVYIITAIYAFSFQSFQPVLPFLVDRIVSQDTGHTSASVYTSYRSLFHIIQTIGSVVSGLLLDRFGIVVGLTVNFVSCAVIFTSYATVSSVTGFLISNIPYMFVAGFLYAQAGVVRLTPPGTDRLVALGRLASAYAIGGIVGSYTGGRIGTDNVATVAAVAAGSSFLGLLAAWSLRWPSHPPSSTPRPGSSTDGGDTCSPADVTGDTCLHTTAAPGLAGADSDNPPCGTREVAEEVRSGAAASTTRSAAEPPAETKVAGGRRSQPEQGRQWGSAVAAFVRRVASVFRCVWVVFLVKMGASFVNGMFLETRPLMMKNVFRCSEAAVGAFFAVLFVTQSATGAGAVGPVHRLLRSNRAIIVTAMFAFAVMYVGAGVGAAAQGLPSPLESLSSSGEKLSETDGPSPWAPAAAATSAENRGIGIGLEKEPLDPTNDPWPWNHQAMKTYVRRVVGECDAGPAMVVGFVLFAATLTALQFVLAAAATSELSSRVPQHLHGTLLGLDHCCWSLVRVGTPWAVRAVCDLWGAAGVLYVCGGVYAAVGVLYAAAYPLDVAAAQYAARACLIANTTSAKDLPNRSAGSAFEKGKEADVKALGKEVEPPKRAAAPDGPGSSNGLRHRARRPSVTVEDG
eukprot:TRINITY_DN8161_c0_g1_i1.p1 TRINITY_DN8161_c0_g1~~TRINITY_DN8161_c0_g1_i1.p1  ORF type:complete len:643 (+),score=99.85 TRINITY_DN8161_c0_g1_i1:72-2000(+)